LLHYFESLLKENDYQWEFTLEDENFDINVIKNNPAYFLSNGEFYRYFDISLLSDDFLSKNYQHINKEYLFEMGTFKETQIIDILDKGIILENDAWHGLSINDNITLSSQFLNQYRDQITFIEDAKNFLDDAEMYQYSKFDVKREEFLHHCQ